MMISSGTDLHQTSINLTACNKTMTKRIPRPRDAQSGSAWVFLISSIDKSAVTLKMRTSEISAW